MPAAAIEVVRFPEDRPVDHARRPLSERTDDDVQASLRDRLFEFEGRRLDEIKENIDVRLPHGVKGALKAQNGTGDPPIDNPEPQATGQPSARRPHAGAKGVDVAKQRGGGLVGRMSELGQPKRLAPTHAKLAADPSLQVAEMHTQSRR